MEDLVDYAAAVVEEEGSLTDLIEVQYDLDRELYPGLRCREDPWLFHADHELRAACFVTIREVTPDNIVVWSFDLPAPVGSLPASSVRSVQSELKYKHRHNFCAEALQLGDTDKQFSKADMGEGDDDDHRTPDFIWDGTNGVKHVLELATNRGSLQSMRAEYDRKVFSYYPALQLRARRIPVTYTVIVVGPDGVLSNQHLPQEMVNELHARFLLACSLEDQARLIGYKLSVDDSFSMKPEIVGWIEESVGRVDFYKNGQEELLISRGDVEACLVDPDVSVVAKTFSDRLVDIKREGVGMGTDNYPLLTDYKRKFEEGSKRHDMKPVSIMPLVYLPRRAEGVSNIPYRCFVQDADNPILTKLWGGAMDRFQISPNYAPENPDQILAEALAPKKSEVREFEEARKERRRKYHRVDLKGVLNDRELEELADQGLWAKKFKGREHYNTRRRFQQLPFPFEADTSDIDVLLENTQVLEQGKGEIDESVVRLLSKANELTGNSDEPLGLVRRWMGTKLFGALDLISDIGMELAISNKQNCSGKEMIMKRLRHYDATLLISPTKSTEHTFFSVVLDPDESEELSGLPFRRPVKACNGWLYDFVSVKQGKLENICSMSSALISLAAYYAHFYNMECTPEAFMERPEAFSMLMFSLLVRLEDKASTEEVITQTRYMYMEVFKCFYGHSPPMPFKVLSKFPTGPRSRLTLWCIKSVIRGFTCMIEDMPERVIPPKEMNLVEGEDALPEDGWTKLVNWVTFTTIPTATKAVELMYIGYLKNKNECAEGNTDFQVLQKTLEEDFKLPEDKRGCRGNPEGRPEPKEFSTKHVIHGCSVLEKRLASTLGRDWKLILRAEILEKLAEKTTDEIATLKASANIEHSDSEKRATFGLASSSGRIKVMEAIAEKLDKFKINPMASIGEFITHIEETSRGVIADLFKKQQHGGLREIYVLTIESRVVQLFIETIARVLCSYFEEETLTHPRNKLRKLDEHRMQTSRLAHASRSLYLDCCSSTDKTRWNQNLMMGALLVPLIRLTDPLFHPAVQRILNMWSLKLIKMPQRVCDLLLNNTEMTSPTFRTLKEYFWDPEISGGRFSSRCCQFIRLSSGMMQGILHYTSSLLHLCFLNSMNEVVITYLRAKYPQFRFRMTQVCSSDDSASIISVISPPGDTRLTRDQLRVYFGTSLILEVLNRMAGYYCMKDSVKSTTALVDYVEFNSEFLFKNTMSVPIMKFIAASLTISESESFLERAHGQYNLISDLFGSGLPAEYTHLCQIAQALLHYKTLGQSVNVVFPEWVERALELPDPIYGFFLLDTQLMPGVAGFSFPHWLAARSSRIFRHRTSTLVSEPMVITPEGGILANLSIRHGDVKRWQSLVDRVSKGVDVEAVLAESPDLLFRSPLSAREVKAKLALKSMMPGVASSMRKGNPFMQALAMSVYAINTHCFSKTTVSMDLVEGKRTKDFSKTSLLLEMESKLESPVGPLPTDQELKMSFPSHDRYCDIKLIVDRMQGAQLVRSHEFRKRKVTIYVQPMVSEVPLTLYQTCCKLWFNFTVPVSHSIYKRCLRHYQNRLPWLVDTFSASLDQGPFHSPQELYAFVSTETKRSRVFSRVGPGVHTTRLRGQIYQLIRKSQRDGYILSEGEGRHDARQFADQVSSMSLALHLPTRAMRDEAAYEILDGPRIYDDPSDLASLPKKEASLGCIQAYHRGDLDKVGLVTLLKSMNRGLLISYIREQKKIYENGVPKWVGSGTCLVTSEGFQMRVHLHDDRVHSISTRSVDALRRHPSAVAAFFRELRVKPSTSHGRTHNVSCRFDGRTFVHPSMTGTEVRADPLMVDTLQEPGDLRLVIRRGSLSLQYELASGVPITVLSYKHSPGDVILKPKLAPTAAIAHAWVTQRPLTPRVASALVIRSSRSAPERELPSWVAETLLARLKQEGESPDHRERSRFAQNLHEIEEIDIDDADILAIMNEIDMDGDEETLDQMLLAHDGPDIYNVLADPDEDSWCPVLHNLLTAEVPENMEVTRKDVKAFKSLHPFWSTYIKYYRDVSPRYWPSVLSGHVEAGDDEGQNARLIMRLLSIEPMARPNPLVELAREVELPNLDEE